MATDSAQFGHVNGVIWLFSANCDPHTCTGQEWANNDCLHTDDVAVTCPGLVFPYFYTPILHSRILPFSGPKENLHLCANIEAETMLLFVSFQPSVFIIYAYLYFQCIGNTPFILRYGCFCFCQSGTVTMLSPLLLL